MIWTDGDILLTYGKGGFWPPRRWVLWLLYRGIRKYQKAKWCVKFGREDCDYRPTHVRIYLGGRFFEATTPRCQWVMPVSLNLHKKEYRVVRYHRADTLNLQRMIQAAADLNGTPYDIGDLVDFAVSGVLGSWVKKLRIFGDRLKKFVVCSTALRVILKAGGATFWMEAVDPGYFANNPGEWQTVKWGKP